MSFCLTKLGSTFFASTFLLVLFCVTCSLRFEFERGLGSLSREDTTFFRPSNGRPFWTFGYDELIADIYWLAFIQYIGNSSARQADHYSLAYGYLDLITSLSPQFVSPYFFAAFSVGKDQSRPDLAAKLIDRGIAANSDNWYLPYIAGVNQYLFAHDELRASRYYRMASKFRDAPSWLGRQAEILEAKIPSAVKEINVWANVYSNAVEPILRERARLKLLELWSHVYKTAPTKTIKERALNQLRDLGVSVDEKSVQPATET